MINPFIATAVLVMLPAVGDPGCPTAAPLPAVGIVTALSDNLEPAPDPVGDLLREIGRRKLREEINRALYEATQLSREPIEIFLYRSQNPNDVFQPKTVVPVPVVPGAPAEDRGVQGSNPDGAAGRKNRR